MTPEYYKDKGGEWRWRLVSPNGEEVGAATEGYASKQKSRENFELVTGYHPKHGVAVSALTKGPEGVLAGRRLLPREVAALLYGVKFSDIAKLIDMTATTFGESAGYTEAVGPVNPDGTQDFGWIQLNDGHAEAWGMTHDQFVAMAFDPEQSAVYGRRLYVAAGYSLRPWAAFTTGSYTRHLSKSVAGVANFWAEHLGLTPVPLLKYA